MHLTWGKQKKCNGVVAAYFAGGGDNQQVMRITCHQTVPI